MREQERDRYVIVGAGVLVGFITLVVRQAMDHPRPDLKRPGSNR